MAFNSELLRTRLKEAGRKRSFLAELTGVNERTVSRWLNGKNPPKSSDLEKIAAALGCTPQDFDPAFAGEGEVAIHARVSVAAHNAYDLMKLRYGATQRDIMELAPVLFSIVAAYALRVPDQDESLHHQATRRGLASPINRGHQFANGFEIDRQASKSKKCFGLPSADPMEAKTRNLFYEAILRLCHGLEEAVNTDNFTEPDPGKSPSSAGFVPDVEMVFGITGGNLDLIDALTRGRIRLSACLEHYKNGEDKSANALVDVMVRELAIADARYQEDITESREESLFKLKAWRAYYKERHSDLAQEYDKIVDAHCHEDGWFPSYYDESLKDLFWSEPYRESRYINSETLPDYQKDGNDFLGELRLLTTDPISRRFQELQAHRRKVKAEFEESLK